jgi:hypothetical protein
LAEVFGRGGDFVVARIAAEAEQATALSRQLQPLIILIDAAFPGGPGAVRRLAELAQQMRDVARALADTRPM